MFLERPRPPNRTWYKKVLSMLATWKVGGKESCLNIHDVSTSRFQGICYFAGGRMTSLTGWCMCLFPWGQAWTVCHQVWFRTDFSTLPIWETNPSCSPQCRGAVGGSLSTSGRGKAFPLTDNDRVHTAPITSSIEKKHGHPCSKDSLHYKNYSLCIFVLVTIRFSKRNFSYI